MRDARQLLTRAGQGTHAGQILLSGLGSFDAGAVAVHAERVAGIRAGDPYLRAFRRFVASMKQIGAVMETRVTAHPLAIGLGVASPTEVGITLHPTYGVPFVPGEALKNAARRAANKFEGDPCDKKRAMTAILGTPEQAGGIEFWGGWIDPGSASLAPDVMTPHHPSYHATEGKTPPTDFDDPNPVSFLVVPPGTPFTFAVGTASAGEWAKLAWRFADHGLCHEGVGGKTNPGYGRFQVAP